MKFGAELINYIRICINLLQILVTIFLAFYIPFRINRSIGIRNLLKENLKDDINDILKLLFEVDSKLRESLEKKPDSRFVLSSITEIGNMIYFLKEVIRQNQHFHKKLELDSLEDSYRIYKKQITEDLPKDSFRVNHSFLDRSGKSKNNLKYELKELSYKVLQT